MSIVAIIPGNFPEQRANSSSTFEVSLFCVSSNLGIRSSELSLSFKLGVKSSNELKRPELYVKIRLKTTKNTMF